ncbi:hypothetical protein KEJ49_07990 [Candidatus Bathyarchaeota archaeon]|nr:hypothetical protein [Candidatus Bathyarchaeota archaeon]
MEAEKLLEAVKNFGEMVKGSPKIQSLIEEFWEELWGGEGRELGNPARQYFNGRPADLALWVRDNEENGKPCYMSVNPYSAPDTVSRISRLFFDFDAKGDPPNLSQAWEEARAFAQALQEHYGIHVLVNFSGRRGFHVTPFLERPIGWGLSQEHLKQLYNELARMILRGLGYDNLDPQPVGDVKRLARIPYTLHEGSGLMCVPVTLDLQPVLLMPGWLNQFRKHGLPMEMVELAVRHIDEGILDRALKPKPWPPINRDKSPTYRDKSSKLRPCIEAVLSAGDIHEPAHKLKLAAVAEMHAKGYNEEEVIKAFGHMAGFDERKTRYMVRHAFQRGYSSFTCNKIRELGGCLGSSCSRYAKKFGGGRP